MSRGSILTTVLCMRFPAEDNTAADEVRGGSRRAGDQVSARQRAGRWKRACGRLLGGRAVGEGSFADARNNYHYKRARWRRQWRVEIQNLLVATAQNLRKLINFKRSDGPNRPVTAAARCILRSLSRRLDAYRRIASKLNRFGVPATQT